MTKGPELFPVMEILGKGLLAVCKMHLLILIVKVMTRKKNTPGKNENFDIHINEFGEIEHRYNIDDVNEFLNKNTSDWRIQQKKKIRKTRIGRRVNFYQNTSIVCMGQTFASKMRILLPL